MTEDRITCSYCNKDWLVETPKPGMVKSLAGLTGYVCPECSGFDPAEGSFPARPAED